MKIIIVGAGIAGASTYLHLRKHIPNPPHPLPPHDIIIYESHKPRISLSSTTDPTLSSSVNPTPSFSNTCLSPSNIPSSSATEPARPSSNNPPPPLSSLSSTIIGGGLGIAPNGMRILANLSPALHAAVTAQGFPCEHFTFRAARGWKLATVPTEEARCKGEVCVSSSREGLWRVLMQKVEEEGGEVKYRRVKGVGWGDDGRWVVRFVEVEEGEEGVSGESKEVKEESADLVIGADGVWSVVKKGLFGEKFPPKYMGLSGVGGFVNQPLPAEVIKDKSMVFTFGCNGFFGYCSAGPVSSNKLMWWSTYSTPLPPTRATLSVHALKSQLRTRHATWQDPVIQTVIAAAEVDSIYPTWTTPELPHWGEKGCVLIGDAAHALQPTSGQGATQALEDGLCLALLLKYLLHEVYESEGGRGIGEGGDEEFSERVRRGEKDAVGLATKLLFEIREPRVRWIELAAERMDGGKKEVGVLVEMIMYGFMWVMGRWVWIAKFLTGDMYGKLYAWDAKEEVKKAIAEHVAKTSPGI